MILFFSHFTESKIVFIVFNEFFRHKNHNQNQNNYYSVPLRDCEPRELLHNERGSAEQTVFLNLIKGFASPLINTNRIDIKFNANVVPFSPKGVIGVE